ncbi:unnamed protein product (macronuclear) [Paramecium tetraurelia]|uniref:Cytochrome P450 n=1 Tax=Paramecium tetraurelia TaxID=5888 RepID=A0CMU6_PARTE|nr:uncharacterized protein GSPATT00038730001 [Paramecium tetraurelia]CAK72113.1 unnamed protein product [Paramecium tetraurelia]|eukprot:XP_001439510.1 hypothetical protein (macronuclear) [Paramecium tetraurelia strain d4-2]
MICYFCLAGLAIFLYVFVIHIFVKLMLLKLKHGKDVYISFIPLFGDYFFLQQSFKKYGDATEIFKQRCQKNPNIKFVASNILNKIFLFVHDPEYYKQVLVNHENYTKVEILYHPKLSSTSILFGEPQKVKQQRSLLGEAFTFEKLKQRTPIINQVLLEKLQKEDKTNVLDFLTKTSSEIIIKTFFCKELQEIIVQGNDITTEMIDLITQLGDMQMNDLYVSIKLALLGRRSFGLFPSKNEKQLDARIDRLIDGTLMPIIKNKIANYKPNQNSDFLDIYIHAYLNQKPNEPKITELELCQLFVSIVSAGTDTTSHQIAITLYYLGVERQAQEEIRQEILNVVGNEVDIQPQHLGKLVLLNAFIQEAFRIKNTVIQPLTRIAKETHYIKNLKVEKGTYVAALTTAPSWNDKYFDDPNKFDYKRWLSQRPIKEDNGYVFVPFSAGGRNCIGQHMAMMTMKIMIGQILRQYDVVVDPSVKVTFPLVLFIQYSPQNLVQLKKRKE